MPNPTLHDTDDDQNKHNPSDQEPGYTSEWTDPALSFANASDRKKAWKQVDELAARWRETRDTQHKTAAGKLLAQLLPSEALIIIKKRRVDAKLPPPMRRDFPELANAVANSLVSHRGKNITAILDKQDPEQGSMRTMVSWWLTNKITDHLRAEPVPGQHKNNPTDTLEDSDKATAISHAETFGWHEMLGDLERIYTPEEFEAWLIDEAGYTNEEGASMMKVGLSTYKRRLDQAKAKFSQYHGLDE